MKSLEEKLRTYITERGLRITPQRLAVLRAVIRLAPDHFDACRLLAALTLDKRTSGFARATVYRTLDHLVDAGILRRLHLASGAAVYELVAGGEHHEHLICERCGKIIEFESPEIESLQDEICRKLDFTPTSHILRIAGICEECSRAQK